MRSPEQQNFQLQISENFVIFTVYLKNLGNYTFTMVQGILKQD